MLFQTRFLATAVSLAPQFLLWANMSQYISTDIHLNEPEVQQEFTVFTYCICGHERAEWAGSASGSVPAVTPSQHQSEVTIATGRCWKCVNSSFETLSANWLPEVPRRGWADNIKIGITEIGWRMSAGFSWLKTGSRGGALMWTLYICMKGGKFLGFEVLIAVMAKNYFSWHKFLE
jgi:hypothetical protein